MKKGYILLESYLTFLLLYILISLYGEILSNSYRLNLVLGLIGGFGFSLILKNQTARLIKSLINISVLGIFIWLIYSFFNSSFIYRDVVLMLVSWVFVLEVILSFNAYEPTFLAYIQALSVVLFMGFPLFAEDYNLIIIIMILGYFACWFAIFKIKFYVFFNPIRNLNFSRYYSIFISLLSLLVIILVSWGLFSNIHLGKIKKGGFFSIEDRGEGERLDIFEKEYYNLQDKVQEKITSLIFEPKSTEERYEVLGFLNYLLKESPTTLEVNKAESGLISYLKIPGPGLEKKDNEGLVILIKNYLNKKTLLNIKRAKENIVDNLKKAPFNIKLGLNILVNLNRIQYSNTYREINKYGKKLRKEINDSSLDFNKKTELEKLIIQIEEWKVFQVYLQKRDSLEQKISSLDEQTKGELLNLLKEVNELEELDDLKNGYKKAENLKETILPQYEVILKELEELLDLKLSMLLTKRSKELKEKLAISNLAKDKAQELSRSVDNIKDIEEYHNFLEDSLQFKEKMQEEELSISQEINSLLETKRSSFLKEKEVASSSMEPGEAKLVSIIISPQHSKISMKGNLTLKTEGYFTDSSHKDITSLVSWDINNKRIISIKNGMITAKNFGETKVYAEYLGIKSMPAEVRVIITTAWLISIIIKSVFFLILILMLAVFALYQIALQKNDQIISAYEKPRQFIIGLYENIKKMLIIFGLKNSEFIPPLYYAELAEKKHSIENNLFVKFTVQFEEAKYSNHILKSQDAASALMRYNNLIKILLNNRTKWNLLFIYCLCLMHKLPFFMINVKDDL